MCHGAARDLDLVIDPDAPSLRRFLASLPAAEYYADADTALDAFRHRGQFNVIDTATAWKADLIIRKARPFSIEEMQRPSEGELLGTRVFVASAEDTVISKQSTRRECRPASWSLRSRFEERHVSKPSLRASSSRTGRLA